MTDLMNNVLPVLFLIAFGYILQRTNYINESVMQGITRLIANLLIPCVIFNTFYKLDIRPEHLGLAACIFLIQLLLLGTGFLVYRFLPSKRRFVPFYCCAFAFGFMAIPLFSTVFGTENMGYLTSMGVGHELFIGIVFVPFCKLYLTKQKTGAAQIAKSLCSPLFFMIFLALIIQALGCREIIEANILGKGLLTTIETLGAISSTLILVVTGYRVRLDSITKIKESTMLVAVRYALIFSICYAVKYFLMDPLVGADFFFDAAFFTLISQHSSVLLNAYVAEYGTREDSEIVSGAFAISVLVGIILFVGYVWMIG